MFWVLKKKTSHRDGSFEYPQHMFWLRNKKNIILLHVMRLHYFSQQEKSQYLDDYFLLIQDLLLPNMQI